MKIFKKQNGHTILCYHSVSNNMDYPYTVDETTFDEHLQYLTQNYQVVPLASIIEELESGLAVTGRQVALTFDDGFADVHENALPILLKYQAPATIFITTGLAEANYQSYMNWQTIIELSKNPLISFGSHGIFHPALTALAKNDIIRELSESKREIEDKLHLKVDFFAYPFGIFNDDISRLTKEAGYRAAFRAGIDGAKRKDLYQLKRLVIDSKNRDLKNFSRGLAQALSD